MENTLNWYMLNNDFDILSDLIDQIAHFKSQKSTEVYEFLSQEATLVRKFEGDTSFCKTSCGVVSNIVFHEVFTPLEFFEFPKPTSFSVSFALVACQISKTWKRKDELMLIEYLKPFAQQLESRLGVTSENHVFTNAENHTSIWEIPLGYISISIDVEDRHPQLYLLAEFFFIHEPQQS